MGGEIRVEFTLDSASTFHRLTLADLADGRHSPCWRSGAAGDEFETRPRRLRRPLAILLAEDNATNQLVFAKLMQAFDVDIHDRGRMAASASSRLRQASSISCSWICACPKWTGWRQRARFAHFDGATGAVVPIIALTANAFADDVKACRDAGMNAFIAKPIRKTTLIQTLADALANYPRRAGIVAGAPARAKEESDTTQAQALPMVPPAEIPTTDVAPILDHQALHGLIEDIDADSGAPP